MDVWCEMESCTGTYIYLHPHPFPQVLYPSPTVPAYICPHPHPSPTTFVSIPSPHLTSPFHICHLPRSLDAVIVTSSASDHVIYKTVDIQSFNSCRVCLLVLQQESLHKTSDEDSVGLSVSAALKPVGYH